MTEKSFNYIVDQFGDLRILRYKLENFDKLNLNQKKLIYHLSEAALCGRDILWDQNNRYNLVIREILEIVNVSYTGDTTTEEFKCFKEYLKRVWFSNGIHHHYSMDKITPNFSREYFLDHLIALSDFTDFKVPCGYNNFEELIECVSTVIFDPKVLSKRVSLDSSQDLIQNSANNFYRDISQVEAEEYYNSQRASYDELEPPSLGLNSQLIKLNGEIKECVWKKGGMYGEAIEKIIMHLENALEYSETYHQERSIKLLIEFYETGKLETFDNYSINWVRDLNSEVDFVNGFIEVYGDALGIKASWESIVNYIDKEATKRTQLISDNAQWFEDHSPTDLKYKKSEVKGVSAKVINVAMLAGDCYPATPIGINLPNSEWIREKYGSKSVTIDNITSAYHKASLGDGFLKEFAFSEDEILRTEKHGNLGGNLHTDLHECLGHGSGKLCDGISPDALKNYHSTIEEARADLFALYYIYDQKLVDIGLIDTLDVGKTEYDAYIRNGLLTQLVRIELGKDLEESHMRNRQLIAQWCYEKGMSDNVIEKKIKDNKTYFVINDYDKLRDLIGQLLNIVQKIKSEGDFISAKELVENYGVKIDLVLHKEVLERYKKLNLAPYSGFVNPILKPIYEGEQIVDISIDYTEEYEEQMSRYSRDYGFLPLIN